VDLDELLKGPSLTTPGDVAAACAGGSGGFREAKTEAKQRPGDGRGFWDGSFRRSVWAAISILLSPRESSSRKGSLESLAERISAIKTQYAASIRQGDRVMTESAKTSAKGRAVIRWIFAGSFIFAVAASGLLTADECGGSFYLVFGASRRPSWVHGAGDRHRLPGMRAAGPRENGESGKSAYFWKRARNAWILGAWQRSQLHHRTERGAAGWQTSATG